MAVGHQLQCLVESMFDRSKFSVQPCQRSIRGFFTAGNIVSLVQNVSILGVLGVGMALTIIGRGIDLSMVANMAISVAWVLFLANGGTPLPLAILCGLAFCLTVGLINAACMSY